MSPVFSSYSKLRPLHFPFRTLSFSSRNLGLTLAQGKYVYFMDDDDALMPQFFQTLINVAEESQAEAVYMNSFYIPSDPEFTSGTIKLGQVGHGRV